MAGIEITKEKIIIKKYKNLADGSQNVLFYDKDEEFINEIKVTHSSHQLDKHLTIKIKSKTKLELEFDEVWFIDEIKAQGKTLILDLGINQTVFHTRFT